MTINLRNVFGCLCVFLSTAASGQQPKADDNAIVKSGNARFTVLTPEMIRIEYSYNLFADNQKLLNLNNIKCRGSRNRLDDLEKEK